MKKPFHEESQILDSEYSLQAYGFHVSFTNSEAYFPFILVLVQLAKRYLHKKNAKKLPCLSFIILDRSLVMRLLLSEYRTDQQNPIMSVPVATRTGLRFTAGLPGVKIEFDRKHTHITATPR